MSHLHDEWLDITMYILQLLVQWYDIQYTLNQGNL